MRKLLLLSLMCFGAFQTDAQIFAIVGSDTIDKTYLNTIKSLNPEFVYSKDAERFEANLFKYLVATRAVADTINKTAEMGDPAVAKALNLYLKLSEERFWQEYANSKPRIQIDPTEQAIEEYYNTVKSEKFTMPGMYSFIQAYVNNQATEKDLEEAKEVMKRFINDLNEGKDMKAETETAAFNYEQNITVGKNHPLFEALSQTKLGEISDPVRTGSSIILIAPIEIQSPTLIPLSNAKQQCIDDLRSQDDLSALKAFRNECLTKYPIRIR